MINLNMEDQNLLSQIEEYLLGSCNTINDAIQAFNLTASSCALEKAMVEREISLCNTCDWWHEMYELTEIDSEGFLCEDCLSQIDQI